MPVDKYNGVPIASITAEYLHTNSTSHEFLFGAIAELVDNSRDAGSKELLINMLELDGNNKGFSLSFIDDGCGMLYKEALAMMMFGHSAKRDNVAKIGRYGNGLKSGAMRLGRDLIVFTKRQGQNSVLMLSRTFLSTESIDDVVTPAVAFDDRMHALIGEIGSPNEFLHEMQLEIITKYSKFKTLDDIKAQFDKIKTVSGTLVWINNLETNNEGHTLLSTNVENDIQLRSVEAEDKDKRQHEELYSLRAYLSVLYSEPMMKIYLRNKKVDTKLLSQTLAHSLQYQTDATRFTKRFKQCLEEDKKTLANDERALKETQHTQLELQSEQRQLRLSSTDVNDKRNNAEEIRRKMVNIRDRIDKQMLKVDQMQMRIKNWQELIKTPPKYTMTFGINVHRRWDCGAMIYHNGRLIRLYERMHRQNEKTTEHWGVVCVVDVPYAVMEPTHNKQDFTDSDTFRQLKNVINEHQQHYWDTLINKPSFSLVRFWPECGYPDMKPFTAPSNEPKYLRHRLRISRTVRQCDQCLLWREILYRENSEFEKYFMGREPWPPKFKCAMLRKTNVKCGQKGTFTDILTATLKVNKSRKSVNTTGSSEKKSNATSLRDDIKQDLNKTMMSRAGPSTLDVSNGSSNEDESLPDERQQPVQSVKHSRAIKSKPSMSMKSSITPTRSRISTRNRTQEVAEQINTAQPTRSQIKQTVADDKITNRSEKESPLPKLSVKRSLLAATVTNSKNNVKVEKEKEKLEDRRPKTVAELRKMQTLKSEYDHSSRTPPPAKLINNRCISAIDESDDEEEPVLKKSRSVRVDKSNMERDATKVNGAVGNNSSEQSIRPVQPVRETNVVDLVPSDVDFSNSADGDNIGQMIRKIHEDWINVCNKIIDRARDGRGVQNDVIVARLRTVFPTTDPDEYLKKLKNATGIE